MNLTNISNILVNQTLNSEEVQSTLSLSSCLSEAETVGVVLFLVLVGLVGFVQNLILILSIILTDGFSDAPANVFVLSLACADSLMSGVSAPMFIFNCLHDSTFAIFMTVSRFIIIASIGSIFLLTINRLISIIRPLKYPNIMTFKRTVCMLGGVWFVASLVLISAVIGLVFEVKSIVFITRYFISFCFISCTVMYMYMYLLGREHRKQIAQLKYAVAGQILATSEEFKALRSLFMVAGSFGLCWLPVTVAAFFTDSSLDPVSYYRAFVYTAPLCYLNSIVDPAVYYYRSKGFRLSLTMLVRRFRNTGCCECW